MQQIAFYKNKPRSATPARHFCKVIKFLHGARDRRSADYMRKNAVQPNFGKDSTVHV